MTNWLTGWLYRKSHLITASAGAGTLYQTLIKVYKTTGTDGTEAINGITAGKIYVGSHCRDDFGDIRFTDNDGDTLLDYWMVTESLVSGTSAVFWVEVADTLESNATIYVYYSKSDATDASNGVYTFLLFDHFTGGSLDGAKWVQFLAGGGLAPTVSGTDCTLTVHPAVSPDSSGIQSVGTFTNNIAVIVRRKHTNNPTEYIWYCGFTLGSGTGCDYLGGASYPHSWTMHSSYYWWYYTTTGSTSTGTLKMPATGGSVVIKWTDTAPAIVYNTYQQHEYRLTSAGAVSWLINGTSFDSGTETTFKDDAKKILINAGSYNSGNYGSSQNIDYVLVRKFIATEPAHSTWGDEEIAIVTKTITYSIDVIFQKLGITNTDFIDVLFKKLGIPATYNIDVLMSLPPYPYNIDVLLEKFGITKPYSIDILLKKLSIPLAYSIDTKLVYQTWATYYIDTIFKKLGITPTDSIDVLFKKTGITKTDSVDILFKKLDIPITTSIDVMLGTLIPPTPPAEVPETLKITNGTSTLWARPISWKENQSCTPAIRPLPLAESEYLDSDTWVLKPRTIECKIRLSDREKDMFEKLYNDAPVNGSNKYLDFYLLYNDFVNNAYTTSYTWHYLVWITDKSYKFVYAYQNNRYVRWWIVTLTCDVQAFSGSSSTLPTWDDDQQSNTYGYTTYLEDSKWSIYNSPYYDPIAKAVKISDEKLDHILSFARDDSHPPMIPKWINQLAEVDSYIWNECVLDTSYTCRMTNAEKYHMDLLLQAHQKVLYTDYIHNVFSPKLVGQSVPTYGAWIASVEATWDPTNWIKPWEVSIALKANNSETESRTANVTVYSSYNEGNMFLDEITVGPNPNATSSTLPWVYDGDYGNSNSCDVGVHMFYFFQPTNSIWDYWLITGDAIKLISQGDSANGIGGEHILTVLIYGDCTIGAIFHYPVVPAIVLDSYLEEDPSSRSEGLITVDGTGYSLPYGLTDSVIATPYTLEFWLDPCLTSNVFDHWESSANITIVDPSSASTTFTLDSGSSGTITAVYKGDFQIDIDYSGYINTCNSAIITVDGVQYTCPDTIYEFFGDWTTSTSVISNDYAHIFDHWETTGGVTVDNIYDASTIIHVTANGTLTAVFHNIDFQVLSNHPIDGNQGQFTDGYGHNGSWFDIPLDWASMSTGDWDIGWRENGNGGTFIRWETTGGVTVADPNSNHTLMTITDSGTLTAIYSYP